MQALRKVLKSRIKKTSRNLWLLSLSLWIIVFASCYVNPETLKKLKTFSALVNIFSFPFNKQNKY